MLCESLGSSLRHLERKKLRDAHGGAIPFSIECKLDGFRCVLHKTGSSLFAHTRQLNPVSRRNLSLPATSH